jgi:hypothetical protein
MAARPTTWSWAAATKCRSFASVGVSPTGLSGKHSPINQESARHERAPLAPMMLVGARRRTAPPRVRRSPMMRRNATVVAAHSATGVVDVESVGRASGRGRESVPVAPVRLSRRGAGCRVGWPAKHLHSQQATSQATYSSLLRCCAALHTIAMHSPCYPLARAGRSYGRPAQPLPLPAGGCLRQGSRRC